jgi:pantothenate kinase-related protein Tda10
MDRQRPYPESSTPSTRTLIAALLAAPASAGATRVLAIDGRSGSGKSTIAREIAGRLEAPLVSLEDLYGGWDGLEHGIERARSELLEPLARGQAAAVPRYDWQAGNWGEAWTLAPPALLVLEGVGAGARALAPHISVLAWLELDASSRRRLALERDGDLYAPHWQRWADQEDAYVEREAPRERADLVLECFAHGTP